MKDNIKKISKSISQKWLDFPAHNPILGEEIVVCYGDTNKKEIVTWTMRFVGSNIKFKFFRLPPIP